MKWSRFQQTAAEISRALINLSWFYWVPLGLSMELRWTAFERLPLGLNELAGSFHGPYLGFNLFLTWFHTVFYCENGLLRV